MNERHLTTNGFDGYELIDSGEHEKLERFGEITVARPDTQAIWKKNNPDAWAAADASFAFDGGKGSWKKREGMPEEWPVAYGDASFVAKLTNFKHVGLFPEQEPNWSWSKDLISKLKEPQVLNLFGYTGAASIVAAKVGAKVTHVDSSKASVKWTEVNAAASNVPEGSIRYILEDARSFAKREARREAKYDGILLDPPAFGRGAKDEVWKIEEDLLPLMETLRELLSDTPGSFFLLNGYAAGYSPLSFKQLVESVFPGENLEFGELRIKEKNTQRAIPAGMFVRFSRSHAITEA